MDFQTPNRGSLPNMLKPQPLGPIPRDTLELGRLLLPEGDFYRVIGEQFADLLTDEDFAALYSHTGQPAYSPARLSLILVLQATEHISDRSAAHMLKTRLDWKYALHLPLNDTGVDASVLSEFRHRLIENEAERKLFDALLQRLKVKGLLKGRATQRTDSIIILSAVRQLNRLELCMETMRLALEAIIEVDAEWFKANLPVQWVEKYGEWIASENIIKERGAQAKGRINELLKETGRDGYRLLEEIASQSAPREIKQLKGVALLDRVWKQEYQLVSKEATTQIEVELSTKESRQKDGIGERICTPHDEDVRYVNKQGKEATGYKLHLTEVADQTSPQIITDVEVVSANEYDGKAVKGIQQRLNQREVSPDEQLADSGYVNADTIAESHQRGIKLVGPVQGVGARKEEEEEGEESRSCLEVEKFSISVEETQAVCPRGEKAKSMRESVRTDRGKKVVMIVWGEESCRGCEMAPEGVKRAGRGRILKLSGNYTTLSARREEQKEEEFRKKYARRAGIEASLSEMTRGSGGRKSRYRGRDKTRLQYLAVATGMNLKRAIRWERGERPARKREVRLKKLMGMEKTTRKGWAARWTKAAA